jgi:carbamoyltransferase
MSTVIGIHDGHNASVAVVRDGRLELALQEERLTRVKNQGHLPRLAAQTAMDLVNGDVASARAALNGRSMRYGQWSCEAGNGWVEKP